MKIYVYNYAKAIWLAVFIGFSFIAQASPPGKIFIVASYEKDHICGAPQEVGVIEGLRQQNWTEGKNLVITRYYMDTKRNHTTPSAMRHQGELALAEIKKANPDVIVFLDDNAIREVMLPLIDHEKYSLVFSGMNGQPEDYDKKKKFINSRSNPGHNATGVYEKLYMVDSLRVLNEAIQNLEGNKVVIITDYSPTGNALTKQFEIELKHLSQNIICEIKRVDRWEEYKKLIHQTNSDDSVKAIYPVALRLTDANGTTYTADKIFAWTIAHSKKPEMALNYYFSKIGLFGGAAVDFKKMGILAGEKASKILNGAKAGTLPIEDAPNCAIVFNITRAKALGIDIPSSLLTAADFVFK